MSQWVGVLGQPKVTKISKHALTVTSPLENPTKNLKKIFLMSTRRLAENCSVWQFMVNKGWPITAV